MSLATNPSSICGTQQANNALKSLHLRSMSTPHISVHEALETKLNRMRNGSIIVPADFAYLGSETAVRSALTRLCSETKLKRLANGIYLLPKKDPVIGMIYPSLEEIAVAIAKRDKAQIRATGAYALNKLGLSTQVPMQHVYITDGVQRTIAIGKAKIIFKRTAPKKLSLKGKISSLLIPALEELGEKNITTEISEKIKHLLKKEKRGTLQKDLLSAPAWVRNYIRKLETTDK